MEGEKSENIRTITIKQRKKNGDIYILERQILYDPKKKYNKVISSKLIGKIQKGNDKVVATRPKRSKNEIQSENSNGLDASRQRIGMMDIIDFIGKESQIDKGIYDNTDMGLPRKSYQLHDMYLRPMGIPCRHRIISTESSTSIWISNN